MLPVCRQVTVIMAATVHIRLISYSSKLSAVGINTTLVYSNYTYRPQSTTHRDMDITSHAKARNVRLNKVSP